MQPNLLDNEVHDWIKAELVAIGTFDPDTLADFIVEVLKTNGEGSDLKPALSSEISEFLEEGTFHSSHHQLSLSRCFFTYFMTTILFVLHRCCWSFY